MGPLSESVRVFDPQALKHIAEELGQQILKIRRANAGIKLTSIDKLITAMDGSVIKVLRQVAELAWFKVGDNNVDRYIDRDT